MVAGFSSGKGAYKIVGLTVSGVTGGGEGEEGAMNVGLVRHFVFGEVLRGIKTLEGAGRYKLSLTLHCHKPIKVFFIQMGSDVSHFNVSLLGVGVGWGGGRTRLQ